MMRALPNVNFESSMSFFRDELKRFDFLGDLSRVRCPTLVIGGSDDPITTFADSEDLAAALPPSLVRLESFSVRSPGLSRRLERFVELIRRVPRP